MFNYQVYNNFFSNFFYSIHIKKISLTGKMSIFFLPYGQSNIWPIVGGKGRLPVVMMYISFHFQSTDAIVTDSVVKAGI